MADNVETLTPEQQQAEYKAQLDQQMGLALGTAKPSETNNAGGTNGQQNNAEPAAPVDPFSVFKERFGYDTPETAIKEIEELRAYKATPIVPELKFENAESEKIVRA